MSDAVFASPVPGAGQHATKLARSVYSGQIAARLREAIIGGDLTEGEPLVEMRLAEQLLVSRGPVRSALHALEGEGLVRTRRNGRMEVAGFGERDLHDLIEVRFELESRAIRWGIEAGGGLEVVETAFALLEAEGSATARLVDLDLEFHRSLVTFSGRRFLVQAWLAIAPVISAVITIGNQKLTQRDPQSNFTRIALSHRHVLDALRAGDADAAVGLLGEQFTLTMSMFDERVRKRS